MGDRHDVRCGNSVEICRDPNRKETSSGDLVLGARV